MMFHPVKTQDLKREAIHGEFESLALWTEGEREIGHFSVVYTDGRSAWIGLFVGEI
jgi:hypothetical protein